MAYDATKPLDNGYLADAPAELRELFRALKEDKIVNAGQLNGYTQGNASGNIPLNNGTVNINLNADLLDGHDSAYFSAATHGHDDATTNASGFMSATDKTKLNGIATGAEVNQNAFSNVTVGNSTIQADGKTDTLTLAAGTGITLTADTTNDKVTIKVTDNTYAAASHTHDYVPRSGGTMTGNLTVTGLVATGNVSVASAADSSIKIKKADGSTAPNNGVVLEYSMASGWVGQLYLGDNADTGLYWNGWSNGTRGEWKRIAFASDIPANAEENQNAFSNFKVGNDIIQADNKTDTLTLVAGTGITLTADTTNDTVTVAGKEATTSYAGLMSATDKTKLNAVLSTYIPNFIAELGSNYVMNASDFTRVGLYKCSSLATSPSGNAPESNPGDYYIWALSDNQVYRVLMLISPRYDYNVYIGRFWNNVWQGWRKPYSEAMPKTSSGVGQIAKGGPSQKYTPPSGGTWEVWGDIHNGNSTANGSVYTIVSGGTEIDAGSSQTRTNWFAKRIA